MPKDGKIAKITSASCKKTNTRRPEMHLKLNLI